MDGDTEREIRRLALQNAFLHGGCTREKIILSKLLGSRPEFRSRAAEIMPYIGRIVSEVNARTVQQQEEEIRSEFPDALVEPERREDRGLPELRGAVQGQVVTRFPPEPNGYPHIGHAKAAIINEEYAKKYGGRSILRMDDTNPENERLEYYAAIKVGLDWLGIKYDVAKNTSDDMELLLKKGEEMISSGHAYVCTCKRDQISRNRSSGTACGCSRDDIRSNIERWEKMSEKYKPGEAAVRFRGDMGSENTVMRDPVLFRIVTGKHPLLGDRYRVWPSYDFAVAIEDSIDGVTHAFRTKEYELRNELYGAILDRLGMRRPVMSEFSRLELEGMPVSKRVIKPLIESGKVSWYDDPRLPTLEALKRRGIRPEAVRRFVLSLGLTKSDTLAPFEALESFNRSLVDPQSIRLHMVADPRSISIDGLPPVVQMANHPTEQMGSRRVGLDSGLYVPAGDVQDLAPGDHIRLMGLGNVRIDRAGQDISGTYVDDKRSDHPRMQWVPQDAHKLKIIIPRVLFTDDKFNEDSLEEMSVLAEPHYLEVEENGMIQFVRFGYCRKESRNVSIYTHK